MPVAIPDFGVDVIGDKDDPSWREGLQDGGVASPTEVGVDARISHPLNRVRHLVPVQCGRRRSAEGLPTLVVPLGADRSGRECLATIRGSWPR